MESKAWGYSLEQEAMVKRRELPEALRSLGQRGLHTLSCSENLVTYSRQFYARYLPLIQDLRPKVVKEEGASTLIIY